MKELTTGLGTQFNIEELSYSLIPPTVEAMMFQSNITTVKNLSIRYDLVKNDMINLMANEINKMILEFYGYTSPSDPSILFNTLQEFLSYCGENRNNIENYFNVPQK